MAYANYRYKGYNFIGEVHGEHVIPLAGLTDIGPETPVELLASAARLTESRVPLTEVTVRAASPRAGKILCVGLNYKDHAGDTSMATFPVLFPKYASTLIGPADDIILPPESSQVVRVAGGFARRERLSAYDGGHGDAIRRPCFRTGR
jgi:acylpyruvate hydrolase